jgi:aldose 1-epimerase
LFKVNYIVNSQPNEEFLEIFSSDKSAFAKIHLNQGASLQALSLKGQELIKDMSPMTY